MLTLPFLKIATRNKPSHRGDFARMTIFFLKGGYMKDSLHRRKQKLLSMFDKIGHANTGK